MTYEWDSEKADQNLAKHGIDFADAVTAFEDLNAMTIADPDHEEERFITLGMDAQARLLVVVYTYRGDALRIISARKAEKKERSQYGGDS